MKLEVDKALCSGHALCWREAPHIFPLDEEGYNALADQGPIDIAPESEDVARQGAGWCPEKAIRLID